MLCREGSILAVPKTSSQGTPAEICARRTAEKQQQRHKGHQIPFGSWSVFFLPCRTHFLCKMLWQDLFWRQHLPQLPAVLVWYPQVSLDHAELTDLMEGHLDVPLLLHPAGLAPCRLCVLLTQCPPCLTRSSDRQLQILARQHSWLFDESFSNHTQSLPPLCYSQTANSDRILKRIQLKGNSDIIFPSI